MYVVKTDPSQWQKIMSYCRICIRIILGAFLVASVISVTNKDELLKLLNRVAGVYTDPSKGPIGVDLSKTVLITGCNHGFLNHLHNFKCFADRLGMKFLVIAMDHKAHQHLSINTSMVSYEMSSDAAGQSVTGESQEFRSKQFNLITARKKEAVHDILSLGFDVLFSDTDVAMIRDPLPYMLFNNVDYVHSLNYMCKLNEPWDFRRSKIEGNTGFYFVRSNTNTIKLWSDAFAAAPKYPKLDDQAIFWKVIRESVNPTINPLDKCKHMPAPTAAAGKGGVPVLTTCMIDTCVFSSGMLSRVYIPELTYGK